jgi:hypothetical protein
VFGTGKTLDVANFQPDQRSEDRAESRHCA